MHRWVFQNQKTDIGTRLLNKLWTYSDFMSFYMQPFWGVYCRDFTTGYTCVATTLIRIQKGSITPEQLPNAIVLESHPPRNLIPGNHESVLHHCTLSL